MEDRTERSKAATGVTALALVVLGLACQATETVKGHLPQPVARAGQNCMRGGAATVDITPEPGYSMGGHSIAGAIARGVWTRLRARCLYLEDPDGSPLVLCASDLWSIGGSLADRVAEIVGRDPDGRHIGRERIVLAATHTHHGPAGFSAHTAYAVNAGRLSGFDPDLHEFLAVRIARGILTAVRTAEPVQLRWGSSRMVGVQRNRSLEAFLLDPDAAEVMRQNHDAPIGPCDALYPDPKQWLAVDPSVRILAMNATDGRLVGAAAFAAVHPTAMRAVTEVYHGDLFGVAAIKAETSLNSGKMPTIALFNGAEGDVSPNWKHQDRIDAVENGHRLAQAILTAERNAAPVPAPLRVAGAFAHVPLGGARWNEGGVERRTAEHAVPGAGQVGGAEDGRTLFHSLGWVEGVRGMRQQREHARGQGIKLPAFEPSFDLAGMAPFLAWLLPDLTEQLAKPGTFPKKAPLGVYRVGPLWFATLPGEFTTVMGRRTASRIAESVGVSRSDVHLIGLANEYVSYFSTPEEYEAQHYEGASTLYGAESGPWIAYNLANLAQKVTPAQGTLARSRYRYEVKPVRHFGLGDLGEAPLRHDDGLEGLLVDAQHRPRRDRPHVEWTEPPTASLAPGVEPATVPFVRVRDARREIVASADGIELLTVALARTATGVRWSVIWLPEHADPGPYLFFVVAPDGTERQVGSFEVEGERR